MVSGGLHVVFVARSDLVLFLAMSSEVFPLLVLDDKIPCLEQSAF